MTKCVCGFQHVHLFVINISRTAKRIDPEILTLLFSKRLLSSYRLYGVTYSKTVIFRVISTITLNLTCKRFYVIQKFWRVNIWF